MSAPLQSWGARSESGLGTPPTSFHSSLPCQDPPLLGTPCVLLFPTRSGAANLYVRVRTCVCVCVCVCRWRGMLWREGRKYKGPLSTRVEGEGDGARFRNGPGKLSREERGCFLIPRGLGLRAFLPHQQHIRGSLGPSFQVPIPKSPLGEPPAVQRRLARGH